MKKALLSFAIFVTSGIALGQVINTYPYNEDFEGETTTATNCGNAHVMSSVGWNNDLTDSGQDWLADNNGTGSTNTGPTANGGADHNPGIAGGIYMVVETSGGCGDNVSEVILESPWFDLQTLPAPWVSFWYHLYGADMATALMHFDARTGLAGGWTNDIIPAWTDDQDVWQEATTSLGAYVGEDSVQFRIRFKVGASFGSDAAIDDFSVFSNALAGSIGNIQHNICVGEPLGSMTAMGTGGTAPYSYLWDTGDTTATITDLAAGVYCVDIIDAANDTVNVCDTIFDLASSPLTVHVHTPQAWVCTDSFGLLVIDSIVGGDTGMAAVPCGLSTLVCQGTIDTISVDTTGTISTNTGTGYPAPLGNWYWGNREQMLYRASELQAMGVQPGNINGIAFFIQSMGTSTTTLVDWTIRVGCTPANNTLAWNDTATLQVLTPATITIGPGWNWYNFDTPYYWNGVDNLLIETCFNNSGFTNNPIMTHTTPDPVNSSTIYYRADVAGVCASSNITGTSTLRPVTLFSNCFIDNSASWPYDYMWSNGSVQDTTVVGGGTYIITVTDALGCTIQDSLTIFESAPVNVDTMVICDGNDNQFPATPGFNSYSWNTGDTTQIITINAGGWYTVTATDSLGCVTTDSALVTTIPSPLLIGTAVDELLGNDGFIDLQVYGNAWPFTFDWDNDGTGDNDDTQNLYQVVGGTYTVVVTDTNGCYSTLTITVGSQVGIEEELASQFNVYPNPSTGLFTIQPLSINGDNVRAEIQDVTGRLIENITMNGMQPVELDLSSEGKGMYLLRLFVDDKTATIRLVVE